MTQDQINKMCEIEGLWIVGDGRHPTYSHAIASMNGQLHNVALGSRLCAFAQVWANETHVVAGPLTVQNQRDLNEKAAQVDEYCPVLQHDLATWKARALAAEAKLQPVSR